MRIGDLAVINKSDAVAASRDRRAAERARFGARAAELRNQAGLDQTDVAAAADMSRVTLSQLETTKQTSPSPTSPHWQRPSASNQANYSSGQAIDCMDWATMSVSLSNEIPGR